MQDNAENGIQKDTDCKGTKERKKERKDEDGWREKKKHNSVKGTER